MIVIDEAQCIFNSRDWNGKGIVHSALKKQPDSRMDWIKFFSQHRKFGFNVILIGAAVRHRIKQRVRVVKGGYALVIPDHLAAQLHALSIPLFNGQKGRRQEEEKAVVFVREHANSRRRRVTLARMKDKVVTAGCLKTVQRALRRRNGRRAGRG